MSTIRWILIIILVVALGIKLLPMIQQKVLYKNFQVINYKLDGKSRTFLVADNPQQWEEGLMNYRKLPYVDGMIFIFPDKQLRTFWNKNTLMNLTLYWINGDTIIGTSQLPSIEETKSIFTVSSPGPADKVVELAPGK